MGTHHSSQQQHHASATEESPVEKVQFARLYKVSLRATDPPASRALTAHDRLHSLSLSLAKELRDKSDEDETPVEEGVFKVGFTTRSLFYSVQFFFPPQNTNG